MRKNWILKNSFWVNIYVKTFWVKTFWVKIFAFLWKLYLPKAWKFANGHFEFSTAAPAKCHVGLTNAKTLADSNAPHLYCTWHSPCNVTKLFVLYKLAFGMKIDILWAKVAFWGKKCILEQKLHLKWKLNFWGQNVNLATNSNFAI